MSKRIFDAPRLSMAVASPERAAKLRSLLTRMGGSDTSTQCERLLAALMLGPINTDEARRHLDIPSPAPRVFTLRHERGLQIQTFPQVVVADSGIRHRFALYVLMSTKTAAKARTAGAPALRGREANTTR